MQTSLHRTILLSTVAVHVLAHTVLGQVSLPSASAAGEAMRRANDYWIASNSAGNSGWARGAYNTGNQRASRVLGERAYHNWALSWGNANQWEIGPEGSGDADAYTCGQTYIDLYRMDLQPLYLANVKSNIDALVASPATNGWTWIDAFYMQAPTLARLGNLTGDTNYYSKLWFMYDYMKTGLRLFDSSASLWYRDDTYTNAVAANGQKVFWSRGNGWVFAGLARVLQQMSTNAPHYQDYVTMFQTMAPAIQALQGPDGMWRSSLYDYNQYPNPETSGTGLFTYGLAWGVRDGLLAAASYTNTIALAWQGLTNLALNANGLVGWVQAVGAQPAAATATSTTDFGVGAFLLACSEIYLLAPDAPAIRPWAGPDQTVVVTNGSAATISLDASQTEIYTGTAQSYSWWEGTTNLALGITASITLALGPHVVTLQVLGSDGVICTDSMTVTVSTPLMALYAFEGNALDSSGNGNNGAASNVTYVAGKVGAEAAQFNGTNSYVGIPAAIQDDFTVALWVKTTDTGGTGAQWWSGKGLVDGEVSGTAADWGTAVLNGRFALGIGSPDTTFSSTSTINDGHWHHVAATRSNATGRIQLYVDGVLQTAGTGPVGSRSSSPGLRIGGIQTGVAAGFLNGSVDDVRLYANVLSALAILSLFNGTEPPTAPTSLAAASGNAIVNLTWTQSASVGITTNRVYRSTTGSSGPYSLLASVVATTSYSDAAVANGNSYFYAVTAVNSNGESATSIPAGATLLDTYVLWQLQYFGCTNCPQSAPDADPLGKGFSNTNQFLLGLDPTNSASQFRIISAVAQGNDLDVTWQTAGGRTNMVQVASDGYTNGFVDLPDSLTILPGAGGAVTNYTDIGATTNGSTRFYRIRLVP